MSTPSEELFTLAGRLESVITRASARECREPLEVLRKAAERVGESSSGSWFGYQSRVYYGDFEPPPSGANFSSEWGLREVYGNRGTTGEWGEHAFEDVRRVIMEMAGSPDMTHAKELATEAEAEFDTARSECLSVIATVLDQRNDAYLTALREQVEGVKIITSSAFIEYLRPKGKFIMRDNLATSQGLQTPPHVAVEAEIFGIEQPAGACAKLTKLIRQAASHLSRHERSQRPKQAGTKVFIGHGRSLLWRSLKDFIQDRLGLPWDEFNRVPVAGVTNIQRLTEMLDNAAVALLVMTAEDELKDGKVHARMNVVHEAGLFQGRLGFTKAIVLLEEGCEEFSNIAGLGQIRFSTGKIEAAFEEVRKVLEREGLIEV